MESLITLYLLTKNKTNELEKEEIDETQEGAIAHKIINGLVTYV